MGLVYLKNTHGPTPYYFDELIKEMKDKDIIEELKSKFYIYPQTKYLIDPRIEPDLSILNGREIEHIDWEIARLSDLTASMLSELSHRNVPWISAEGKKRDGSIYISSIAGHSCCPASASYIPLLNAFAIKRTVPFTLVPFTLCLGKLLFRTKKKGLGIAKLI
jgi:hypothetical protein